MSKRWQLHEQKGDICYEVEGDLLILKLRPEAVANIKTCVTQGGGDGLYHIKEYDNTPPTDENAFTAARVLRELKKSSQYWELITSKGDGTELSEEEYFLRPKGANSIRLPGDVTAFATNPNENQDWLPVAINYTTTGLFRALQGGGLIYSQEKNGWMVDPEYKGSGSMDRNEIEKFLNEKGYIKWSSKFGELYSLPDIYTEISGDDTIISAIGKLERNFDNYVDLYSNQTIGGIKRFNETVYVNKDVVAYASANEDTYTIPVSTNYSTTGLFRAMLGGGLVFDSAANAWKVDSQMVGGLDETQLKAYLDRNKYVNERYLTENNYLNLKTKLTGYQKITPYVPITANDTILTALGKLEGNFGNYVDLTTNQTIGGTKTFKETIYSQKDVVAYATGAEDFSLPVATDYSTTGLFRALSGGGLIYSNGGWRVDPSFEGGGDLDRIDINQ